MRLKIQKCIIGSVIGLVGSFMLFSCSDASSSKTAYVLNARLLKEYKGTEDIKKSLSRRFEKNQVLVDSLKFVFQKIEETKLSTKDIQFKRFQIKESLDRMTSEEERASAEAEAQLWNQINVHVSNYGKENNYSMIIGAMGNGNLMYADSTLDVTSKVIDYMNKKYVAGN